MIRQVTVTCAVVLVILGLFSARAQQTYPAFTMVSKVTDYDAKGEALSSRTWQDKLAKALLEDLAAEEKWDQAFANSHDKLAALADEAIVEFEQGETRPLDESL